MNDNLRKSSNQSKQLIFAKVICQQRNLALTTVLSHINKLANIGKIEHSKRQLLFATIHTDEVINQWILQGLEYMDSIEKMQHHLAIFKQLKQTD